MGSFFSGKSVDNELWNDIYVVLVKDLEKRGILWRYGIKYFKLWIDEIMSGNLVGINEELVWEKYIDVVFVLLKMKKFLIVKIDFLSLINYFL